MPSKQKTDKLSPAAYDRWWRDRIEKEEGKEERPKTTRVKLNSLGNAQEFVIPGDHLVGAGVLVKPKQNNDPEGAADTAARDSTAGGGLTGDDTARSQVGSKSKAGSLAGAPARSTHSHQQLQHLITAASGGGGSKPASVAGSAVSYPKTPSLSAAGGGGSVTSSAIMTRLQRLEQELVRERVRREAAEKEMIDLMQTASRLNSAAPKA